MDLGPERGRVAGAAVRPPNGAPHRQVPPTGDRGAPPGRSVRGAVQRYRRAVEPVDRLRRLPAAAEAILTVAAFVAAAAVGGRGGVAIASAWMAVSGSYCLLNLAHCRETHCAVTGPGWVLAAILGFAAALTPGQALSWYRVKTAAVAYLVILAAGFALERAVAARTGRRALGGSGRAQDC